jgi:hypothetical protein
VRLFQNFFSVSTAAASGLARCVSGLSDRLFDGLFLWTSADNGWHSNFTLILSSTAVHVIALRHSNNNLVQVGNIAMESVLSNRFVMKSKPLFLY